MRTSPPTTNQEGMFVLIKSNKSIAMTNINGNNGDRLDRIEAIVESNSRAIQAMVEQRATDRLEHEARMNRLEDLVVRLTKDRRSSK